MKKNIIIKTNYYKMEELKEYSLKQKLLSEFTNWNMLFSETNNMIIEYFIEIGNIHNFDYLSKKDPFDMLPSDCYTEILFKIISLWFPFYFGLERTYQEIIEYDLRQIIWKLL